MAVPFKIIQLDRPRKIKFTINALILAETLCGKPGGQIVMDLSQTNYETAAKCLFAGLKHEDKDLTFEKTKELIDEHIDNMFNFVQIVSSAFSAANGIEIDINETLETTAVKAEETSPNI